MKFLLGVVTTILMLALAGVTVVWTGAYNIAASDPHADWVAWAFDTTMHNSVKRRAEEIPVPPRFTEEQLRNGFSSYDAMCVQCHGAPGVKATEWAMGMRPNPPPLSEAVTHWNPAEVFWILRNGIKMTGMPALGPTHGDEELWSIVAFVERLPNVTAQEYAALRQQFGNGGAGHHGGGGGTSAAEGHHDGGDGAGGPDSGSAGAHHEGGAGGEGRAQQGGPEGDEQPTGASTEGQDGGEAAGQRGTSGEGHHGGEEGAGEGGSQADHQHSNPPVETGGAGDPASQSR